MEDNSEQCVTKNLKAECDEVITEPMHSKEENFSVFIGGWLTESCLIIATPPPCIESLPQCCARS